MNIHIYRLPNLVGYLRQMKVKANGKLLLKIGNGEEMVVEHLSSPVTLRIHLDVSYSNVVELTEGEGEQVYLIIRFKQTSSSEITRQLEIMRLRNMELLKVNEREYNRYKEEGDPIKPEQTDDQVFKFNIFTSIALGLSYLLTTFLYKHPAFIEEDLNGLLGLAGVLYVIFPVVNFFSKIKETRAISHLKVSCITGIVMHLILLLFYFQFSLIVIQLMTGAIAYMLIYALLLKRHSGAVV